METIKLKLKTPLWTGDIDTRSDIVRASGFMGSLRWWTEVLMRGLEKTFVCDPVSDGRKPGFPGRWYPDKEMVRIGLGQGEPLWGHVLSPEKVSCRGLLEPLVGRNWDIVKGAGQNIKSEGLAWAPGSLLQEARTFEVTPYGTWLADGGTSLKETT